MAPDGKGGPEADAPAGSAERVEAGSLPLKEAIQVYDDEKTGLVDKLVVSPKTVAVLEKAMDNRIYLKVTGGENPSIVLMVGNVEIPDDSPQKAPMSVSIIKNEKWQDDLVIAVEKAILKVNRPRFYHDLQRTDASEQVSFALTDADKPGKIQEELEADMGKIDETTAGSDFSILSGKTAEVRKVDGKEEPKKDEEVLPSEPVSVEDIRYNTRLLNKPKEGEKPEDELKGLKDETARRMRAYSSTTGDGWFKLDYAKFGSDKRGMSHELYVGLGDILLDLDIQNILVERDGQIIKAHRGEVTTGSHTGRIGFLDDNGEYVATHTGDRFRIISNDKMAAEQYIGKYREEKIKRESKMVSFKTSTTDLYIAERDFTMNETITLDDKDVKGNTIKDVPTREDIEMAAANCVKSSPIEKAAAERKGLMKCLNYIAAKVGVPASGMLAVLYHECGIKFPANVGDGGLAVGMGQIHPEGWATVKKDPRFSQLVGPVMKEPPGEAGRNKNIFVDLVGVAIFMKKGIEVFGFQIDHTSPEDYLTSEIITAPDGVGMSRMAWIRTFYHVPSYARDYAKIIKAGNIDVLGVKYKERFLAKSQPWIKKNMHRYIKLSDNTAVAMRSMKAAGTDGGTMMA